MTTIRQLAVESLTHLMAGGQERLAVDDDARSILRSWMLQSRRGGQLVETAAPATPEMSVEEKLALLRNRAEHWKPARRLGTLRDTMVFATGNPHARLMLVGEAPGFDEERLG